MSENLDRGGRDFSRFDSMTTEQLQQILRSDAQQQSDESDTEELFYIMGVLADRKRNENGYAGNNIQLAYEEFQKHYMPTDHEEDFEAPLKEKKPAGRWLRRLAAAAAVLAVVLIGSLGAQALGFDILGRAATWTAQFFHFADETRDTEPSAPHLADPVQYTSLQDALDNFNIEEKLAPTWLPDGYKLHEIEASNSPRELSFHVVYSSNDSDIKISIRKLLNDEPEQIEKSESFIEAYDADGVTYYLFSNYDMLQANWVVEKYECYISGGLTVEEMKEIIDSIQCND